jgi:hypothetical protein
MNLKCYIIDVSANDTGTTQTDYHIVIEYDGRMGTFLYRDKGEDREYDSDLIAIKGYFTTNDICQIHAELDQYPDLCKINYKRKTS